MLIFVKDIHTDMLKTSDNGGLGSSVDSATNKVLIIDGTLGWFIPPQICILTPYSVKFVDASLSYLPIILRLI